jgi:glycosyltransferase involved in cell wall biosynthesis
MRQSFIFVGKYEANKGIDTLVEVIPEILARYPDSTFGFAGSGSYGDRVRQLANKYVSVRNYGFVPRPQLPSILAQYSTFVLPARDTFRMGMRVGSEQYGFSIIEAMSMGMKIISSKCGAIPEVTGYPDTDCELISRVDSMELAAVLASTCDAAGSHAQQQALNREFAVSAHNINKQAARLSDHLSSSVARVNRLSKIQNTSKHSQS